MLARLVSPALALLLVAGCRRPDYFPLAHRASWTYQTTTERVSGADTTTSTSREMIIRVIASGREPVIGTWWDAEFSGGSGIPGLFRFWRRREGLMVRPYSYAAAGNEPIRALAYPLTVGKSWFGNSYHEELFEVLSREDVTVPAGTFRRCLRLKIHVPEIDWVVEIWFAPGVGPVRWERRSGWTPDKLQRSRLSTAELVEFDPGR